MAVDAVLGIGCRLYYSTDNVTYTELTDMAEMPAVPDPTVETPEATPFNPTAYSREFLLGLIDYGSFSFKQFWNKTRYGVLRGRLRTNTYIRFVYNDNPTPTSASKDEVLTLVTKVRPDGISKSAPICTQVECKVTGAATFTAGS